MAFTLEAASGIAFVVVFLTSITLLRAGFWPTILSAIVVYWIVFLLLRVLLDIPEPLSGDAPPVLSQQAAALRDGLRTFLSAPGEILEGIGTLFSEDLAASGSRYIDSLGEGQLARDPYWTTFPWVHVARVIGRSIAAVIVGYIGKLLFASLLWLVWPGRRSRPL